MSIRTPCTEVCMKTYKVSKFGRYWNTRSEMDEIELEFKIKILKAGSESFLGTSNIFLSLLWLRFRLIKLFFWNWNVLGLMSVRELWDSLRFWRFGKFLKESSAKAVSPFWLKSLKNITKYWIKWVQSRKYNQNCQNQC